MENHKSYSEMLEKAKSVHPDLKVRMNKSTGNWEFFIPTNFIENPELDAKFEGTEAWAAYHTVDEEFGNKLKNYMVHESMDLLPLEAVAEKFNIDFETAELITTLKDSYYSEYGTSKEEVEAMFEASFSSSSEEEIEESNRIFTAYKNLNIRATTEAKEKLASANAEWEEKWSV